MKLKTLNPWQVAQVREVTHLVDTACQVSCGYEYSTAQLVAKFAQLVDMLAQGGKLSAMEVGQLADIEDDLETAELVS